MRYILAFILLFCSIAFVHSQGNSRIFLAGTRISIQTVKNVLIPNHTSTIFIDSTIEVATLEFPTIESARDARESIFGQIDKTIIIEEFDLGVNTVKKCRTVKVAGGRTLFQCYFGDSTYGVLTQCIYRNSVPNMKERLSEILTSMRVEKDIAPDMDKFLAYNYDRKSIFKMVSGKYVVETVFTPNGERNDSIFTVTNILSLQFPPAPTVQSSKDLLYESAIGNLASLDVKEVLFEGEYMLNGDPAYKFSAICERNKQTLEVCFIALYDKKSSVFISCQIINGKYKEEAYSFLESVVLKRDGY